MHMGPVCVHSWSICLLVGLSEWPQSCLTVLHLVCLHCCDAYVGHCMVPALCPSFILSIYSTVTTLLTLCWSLCVAPILCHFVLFVCSKLHTFCWSPYMTPSRLFKSFILSVYSTVMTLWTLLHKTKGCKLGCFSFYSFLKSIWFA